MRVIIAPEFYQQMLQTPYHTAGLLRPPGEYLHHMYIDGVSTSCPGGDRLPGPGRGGRRRGGDRPPDLHKLHYDALLADAQRYGRLEGVTLLGDPPPTETRRPRSPATRSSPGCPASGRSWAWTCRSSSTWCCGPFSTAARSPAADVAAAMAVPFAVLNPVLQPMRKQSLIDIVGQKGSSGDASFVYEIKPPKGPAALQDAPGQDQLLRPLPGPVRRLRRGRPRPDGQEADCHPAQHPQGVRGPDHHRRGVQRDRPGHQLGQRIFFFGYPGNGKTSVAERITRLMGDTIYIPHAVEANGQIIKVYDPIQHTAIMDDDRHRGDARPLLKQRGDYDRRFIR